MTIDCLLGLILILMFAIPVVVGVVAIGFACQAVTLALHHFVPALARPWNAELYGLLCLWSLISGIGHLRKQRWPNAFLSFAAIPMIVSVGFAGVRSPLGDEVFFPWPWFVVILNSIDSPATRLEFLVGGLVVATSVAVNTGMLEFGTLAQIAAYGVFSGVLALFVMYFRRERCRQTGSHAPAITGV